MSTRVQIVATSDQRRGAEVFAENLASGLAERGWEVDAVCLTTSAVGPRVQLTPLSSKDPQDLGRLDLSLIASLRKRVRQSGAEILVAYGGPTLRYAVAATWGLAVPVAYASIGEPLYWMRSSAAKLATRQLLKRVAVVLAVSGETKRQLLRFMPPLEGRVHVTETGVPDSFFRRRSETRPPGPLRVVVVGSLSPEKDPQLALDAVSRTDDVKVRFVGDGALREELESSAHSLGVAKRVEFVGSVDDVLAQYGWADVLLLTSRTEGLPGVILEAAAAGVPSVAVDVGGVDEAVQDGVTGLVTERTADSIAAALAKLASNATLLARMGQAATSRAADRFTLERSVGRHESVLRSALGRVG